MKNIHSRFGPLLLVLSLVAAMLAGCQTDGKEPEALTVPRLLIETRGTDYGGSGGAMVTLPVSGTSIPVQAEPLVTEFGIENIELVKVDLGLALLVQLDATATRRLYRASVANNGGRIVLAVNGTAIGARRIDGAIHDGNLFTFVEVPDEDLDQLVLDLKETIEYLKTKEEE